MFHRRPIRFSSVFIASAFLLLGARAQAADPPYGFDTRPALQGVTFPDQPPSTGAIKIKRAFPNLSFEGAPVYLTTAPGDDSQIYVVTKSGMIWQFPNTDAVTGAQINKFLDLTDKVTTENEQGLLGLAFHPQFASNKIFYAYYSSATATGARSTQLSQFTVGATPAITKLSEKKLFKLAQVGAFHKAGCLQIGPDSKLYLSTGDGAVDSHGQDGSAYGRVLRFNLDGTIPADNPFVGVAGYEPAIWARGFRNPWRWSFDRVTGELWLGDVGESRREEINVVRKGGNYGWSVYEGELAYKNPSNLPKSLFDQPLLTYAHDGSSGLVCCTSVTGGYVYRGSLMPSLVGKYIFADFTTGNIYALTRTNGVVSDVQLLGSVSLPTSFGTDNAGNLYVTSYYGEMYRIEPETIGSTNFPAKLSQTGLFTDVLNLVPTQGLIEYEINAPFWSDGAIKRRWVGVPGTGKIGFTTQDAWSWPAMSVVVKHFEMAMADGTTKRLETRVLINQKPGWRGYTYRWNTAGTDADLIDGSQSVVLNVMDPTSPTGSRTQTYEFPSRGACLTCHNSAHGEVLGLRTSQLNRNHQYPGGVTDNQLRTLNHIGMFDRDIGAPSLYYAMPSLTDTTKNRAARARAYFDVNCSQCHSPGGPAQVDIDFRVSTPLGQTSTVNVAPTNGDLGIADARRIAPGSKDRSIVWQRINSASGPRMPPIASHVIDKDAVTVIGNWIDSGAPDSPDQWALRPMASGTYTGSRNGIGNDVLKWSFSRAQSCSLTMYNAVNTDGKALGTFPGTYTYTRSSPAIKTTYTLSCSNPYGTDVASLVVQ